MSLVPTTLDPDSTDILAAADQPILWLCVAGVFAVVAAQTVIYFLAVRRAAPAVGMSGGEVKSSFRAGAVAAIGPSMAVALIAITLISVFGTPGVLTRIGLIGSAAFDVAAAGIAAGTQGATLGGEGYTQAVFATVLLCIALAGAGWMLVTLIATPLLKRGTRRLESGERLAPPPQWPSSPPRPCSARSARSRSSSSRRASPPPSSCSRAPWRCSSVCG